MGDRQVIKNADYKYFNKAKTIADISDVKVQMGCIAVYHKQIIGTGCNCNKTHPIQKKYDRFRNLNFDGCGGVSRLHSLHAEMNCINQIKNHDIDFSDVKLYIYRLRKDQPFGLSRPCPSCMAAIKDLGVRDIYYTTNDGYCYEKLEKCNVGGVA